MRKRATGRISGQTKRFVLKAMYDFDRWAGANATQAANLMNMPQATIIRAFNELAAIEPKWFATVDTVCRFNLGTGKKRFLRKVSPYLRQPSH